MNRQSINIEEILKNIGTEDVPDDVHKIAQETSNNFSMSLVQSKQPKHIVLGDYIMKNRLTKLAVAAAVIIVVVLGGLPFMKHKQSGIVLADVLAKVEQARAFMYKMKMNMSGSMMTCKPSETKMDFTITISKDYGMKCEMDTTDPNTGKTMTQIMYIQPEQKTAITIMPEMKKYMRMEFDDEHVDRMKKQNNDPREMIKQIMGCQYTELGRSVIDGVEVEGFRTTDPAMLGGAGENIKCTFWVDAKSWLPVRAEMDFKMGEQMQASGVIYDYQWDIPVDARDFEPVIPEDFTPISSEAIKMPSISEEAAIEGLKYFVELSGQYPKKLDMIGLMKEFVAIQKSREQTDKGLKSRSEKPDEMKLQGRLKETMKIMRPVQSLAMFYMTLVQDKKEPVYYGESVGPNDGDKVLLRWKVSDNEYRVIFGDLHAETVTPDKLAELEAALPK
jgi:outer membrane lipoprotein-sorting protein